MRKCSFARNSLVEALRKTGQSVILTPRKRPLLDTYFTHHPGSCGCMWRLDGASGEYRLADASNVRTIRTARGYQPVAGVREPRDGKDGPTCERLP
jgi:hypothetical protein